MGEYLGKVRVTLKSNVPDTSGNALVKTLHQLGFHEVLEAKTGKYLEVTMTAKTKRQVTKQIEEMNTTFFANPTIEEAATESIDKIPPLPSGSYRRKPKA